MAAKNGDLNKVKELVNESQADILDASPGVSTYERLYYCYCWFVLELGYLLHSYVCVIVLA